MIDCERDDIGPVQVEENSSDFGGFCVDRRGGFVQKENDGGLVLECHFFVVTFNWSCCCYCWTWGVSN